MPGLSDKELSILNQLSREAGVRSQRSLAKKTGLSLGLINSVLHRLIQRGFIKVKNLDKKNMQYLLTSKGIAHVTRRSYQAVLNTIQHYLEIEKQLTSLISLCIQNGHSRFFLHGSGELAKIAKRCFKKNFRNEAGIVDHPDTASPSLILNLTDRPLNKGKQPVINLLDHIRL